MRWTRLIPLLFSSFLFLFLTLPTAESVEAKEYSFTYVDTVGVQGPISLDLNVRSGKIAITGSEDNFLVITAVKRVQAVSMDEARLAADHIDLMVNREDAQFRIATKYRPRARLDSDLWEKIIGGERTDEKDQVDFVIAVPLETSVSISNTGGRIDLQNLIGDIVITSTAAEIAVNSVEGAIDIETGGSLTSGEILFGPVSVRQPEGEIELRWVTGDITLKSVSANIEINQESGSLELLCASGNVDIQTNLEDGRNFVVETESGDITFSVPATASGDVKIGSQLGEIRTDIPISISSYSRTGISGRFGEGGVSVDLTTGTGDVTVAGF